MRSLACIAFALLLPFILYGEDLTPPAEPLAEQVENAIKPAKDEFLKAKAAAQERYKKVLDAELEKATKAGSLDDVQAINKEKEDFVADEFKWKSVTHKAAIKKYSAELDSAGKKYFTALDALMKEQVRKKNIEVAAKIKEIKESGIEGVQAAGTGGWIDLIPLIDLSKDTVSGKWELKDGKLTCDAVGNARIEIPYQPPEEYNYRIVYTRLLGSTCVYQIPCKSNKQFLWGMGADANGSCVFVGRESAKQNIKIVANKIYTSLIEVRNDGVKAYLDGKLLDKFKDYSEVTLPPDEKLRSETVIGLGCYKVSAEFQKIELQEVKGVGKRLR